MGVRASVARSQLLGSGEDSPVQDAPARRSLVAVFPPSSSCSAPNFVLLPRCLYISRVFVSVFSWWRSRRFSEPHRASLPSRRCVHDAYRSIGLLCHPGLACRSNRTSTVGATAEASLRSPIVGTWRHRRSSSARRCTCDTPVVCLFCCVAASAVPLCRSFHDSILSAIFVLRSRRETSGRNSVPRRA